MPDSHKTFDAQTMFDAMTRLTGEAMCVCEMIVDEAGEPADYRFLWINEHFEEMSGLHAPVGLTALELVPGLERRWIDFYARVGLGGETLRIHADSVPMGRAFDVCAMPGEEAGQFVVLFRDVTARVEAEHAREAALEASRRLLHELSHRVKNNLALISSMLRMETRKADDGAREVLRAVDGRIQAVARLYDLMNASDAVETVDAAQFVRDFAAMLEASVAGDGRVAIRGEADGFALGSHKAIHLGLIVNELVTNAVKHAFRDGPGRIRIRLRREADGAALLEVEDDGTGGAAAHDPSGSGGLLVEAFVRDLGGTKSVRSGPGGTCIAVRFQPEDDAV
ncbi:sensor histidine kinase [Jannaschia sp. W003]|uniref:sensor histidine kinase n=1 Tax=Jannaschia sp. W003 TaxID=2867012 RepID=UPI0021A68D91|nr:sensor histidine kinase [Jannaschia sp. W003]UWQ22602.1 sensor histidine kinase [Jannaschia sp. W003]